MTQSAGSRQSSGAPDEHRYATLGDEPVPTRPRSVEDTLLDSVRPVRHWPVSGWLGHIPWMYAVISLVRPRRFVELGVHSGASFFAACQAVQELDLEVECVGIDDWTGDPQAGLYGESVFEEFRTTAEAGYPGLATWLRADFAVARERFDDGSVDLLHIDGFHSYEAVRGDFATWRSALSARGVVLFHDVTEHQPSFGVWRFWREIEQDFPGRTFTFGHSHGLGVLSLDLNPDSPINQFLELCADPDRAAAVQQFFTAVAGLNAAYQQRLEDQNARFARHEQLLAEKHRAAVDKVRRVQADEARTTSDTIGSLRRSLRRAVEQRETDVAALRGAHEEEIARLTRLAQEAEYVAAQQVRHQFLTSRSWRISRPLRAWNGVRRRLHERQITTENATAEPVVPPPLTLFDADWYRERSGQPAGPVEAALDDYRTRGADLGLSPHPLFDPAWYAAQVPTVPPGQLLEHYLTTGGAAGLSPHPAFDGDSDAALAAPSDGSVNPLVHYLNSPEHWREATCELFDGDHYLDLYPDVRDAGMNPLVHYVWHGEAEGRVPSARFDPVRYRSWAMDGVSADHSPLAHYMVAQGRVPAELALDLPERPVVSVVVPVHGQWAHTARCLAALAETTGRHSFEVIVVDDASPDDTAVRLAAVDGIRVVHHAVNTGYVGACNSGIDAARGEFVVLLNNDTRVRPDWLTPLIESMDDPRVGLVGSKLMYPDGRLQEAGGILFSDGSGWNYGKFDTPERHSYTYPREVDYCSGASIMLRRSVLESLGGLDERFAPAYYDDADLAFGVRSLGLKVVYEPRSVVIHDEGISHGTDETQGVKAYQVVNRRKFTEKWADELTAHCEPDPAVVQRAARRRQGADLVVVVDHYVPRPDQDAGSARMTALLLELRRLGHGVLFVPQNGGRGTGGYAERLEEHGIEVVANCPDLNAFLSELRGQVGTVILSRVGVAWSYLTSVRAALPEARVVFDTVDLHFLREQRQAEVDGVPSSPASLATRELELALVRSCDATLVVSGYERDLLAELVPEALVQVVPTVHPRVAGTVTPEQRDGLLFVGSFAHPPNLDGIRWFITDVLPELEKVRSGTTLTVIGADPDPQLVEDAPANVKFLGWVEDLAPHYATARVSVAPLRFGAGLKGKVGEAMAHGVPVVMTPVGAEGMGVVEGETGFVAAGAGDFALALKRLLDDDVLWAEVSKEARAHVDIRLGEDSFSASLNEVVEPGVARVVRRGALTS